MGNTWRYRIDLDPDPLTGKRRQLTKGGYASKRAAQDACAEALESARRGQLVRTGRKTVSEFLEDWITSRRLDLKPSAWRGYRDYLDAYVLPIIGATNLHELDTIRLNLLYVPLLEQGRTKIDRDGAMYTYYKDETDTGRQPTATAVAAAGGVTYDAGRKP